MQPKYQQVRAIAIRVAKCDRLWKEVSDDNRENDVGLHQSVDRE